MADKDDSKVRKILMGKPQKAPTTGGRIKASVAKLAKHAEMKGVGIGGQIAASKPKVKGDPAATARWKVGIVKGAGIKEDLSGNQGRGRKSKAGFQIKVRF